MNSSFPPDSVAFERGPRLVLRWVDGYLPAGFPSPAADFVEKRHDLNDLMITHPAATFMWQVSGQSMVDFGLFDKDIVVVNRALPALHGKIVVAEVNGEFTVKQFWRHKGTIQLRAGNKTFPPYIFKDGETLAICGVVTWGLRKYG